MAKSDSGYEEILFPFNSICKAISFGIIAEDSSLRLLFIIWLRINHFILKWEQWGRGWGVDRVFVEGKCGGG